MSDIIGYQVIRHGITGMVEYRFRIPFEFASLKREFTDSERVLAEAMPDGAEPPIWIIAGLLSSQLKHIERMEKEQL